MCSSQPTSKNNLTLKTLCLQIQGAAGFNVCISELLKRPIREHFQGHLVVDASVTTADGSTVHASDSSCPVHKYLLELQFTKDTRRHFKPRLPFDGKVIHTGHPYLATTSELRTPHNKGIFPEVPNCIFKVMLSQKFKDHLRIRTIDFLKVLHVVVTV